MQFGYGGRSVDDALADVEVPPRAERQHPRLAAGSCVRRSRSEVPGGVEGQVGTRAARDLDAGLQVVSGIPRCRTEEARLQGGRCGRGGLHEGFGVGQVRRRVPDGAHPVVAARRLHGDPRRVGDGSGCKGRVDVVPPDLVGAQGNGAVCCPGASLDVDLRAGGYLKRVIAVHHPLGRRTEQHGAAVAPARPAGGYHRAACQGQTGAAVQLHPAPRIARILPVGVDFAGNFDSSAIRSEDHLAAGEVVTRSQIEVAGA